MDPASSQSAAWIDGLLTSDRTLRNAGGGLCSALPVEDPGSPYDRRAALYDRVVGTAIYNRMFWGTSPASYAAFAAAAVHASDGPLLDVGCGSAVFTADAYRNARRPIVLVDRSLGMLTQAAQRISSPDPAQVAFMQADLFDLPFRSGSFTTVACHGVLHLFEDPVGVLHALRAQLAAGSSLYASALVAETAVGRRYLTVLHRAGEVAVPRHEYELAAATRTVFSDVEIHREGCMAFITAHP